ncbi:MAG TPA: oxidoreductase, partial [Myxococcaceae bacterium]|nr:oxidoreductase [Myxococcaceae bacterium]
METQPRTAVVAGASGLVGGLLLDTLLEDPLYREVLSLGRRSLPKQHPKLVQRTVDFARLGDEALPPADDAFCCLGTTIKKAGSQEAFRAVDHDAVLAFAKAAKQAGARRFLVVTALGADPGSRVFYNRVKGEVEQHLKGMGFESLVILQPSLLLGERAESRPGERAAIIASRVLAPLLRPLASRPIEARTVARAMVALAQA